MNACSAGGKTRRAVHGQDTKRWRYDLYNAPRKGRKKCRVWLCIADKEMATNALLDYAYWNRATIRGRKIAGW